MEQITIPYNQFPYFAGNVAYPMSPYDKKHLHAFLKGHSIFWHGKDKEGKPIMHKVQRSLKPYTNGQQQAPASIQGQEETKQHS